MEHFVQLIISTLLLASLCSAQIVNGGAKAAGTSQVQSGSMHKNLLAWWEFTGSAGGAVVGATVADKSGHGNTLTLGGNNAGVNPGVSAKGITFPSNYSANAIWQTPYTDPNPGGPKTVITVFEQDTGGGQAYVVGFSHSQASGVFVEFGTNTHLPYGTFSMVTDTVYGITPRPIFVPDGQWTFGAARAFGCNSFSSNVNLDHTYGQVSNFSPPCTSTWTFGETIWVGKGSGQLSGTVAEVMLYGRALSDQEVQDLYLYFKARLAPFGIPLP